MPTLERKIFNNYFDVSIGEVAGGVLYPMAFYPERNNESALKKDFWIIKEE